VHIPGRRWFIGDASYLYEALFMNRDFFNRNDLSFRLDRPGDIEALNAVIEMRRNGWDMNTRINSVEHNAAQANGSVAMLMRGCWHGGFLKAGIDPRGAGNWRITTLPAGISSSNNGGSYVSIPSQGRNKDAAWSFIEFTMTTIEGQNAMFRAVDYFPAFMPAWNDPMYQEPDPYFGGQRTRALWSRIAADVPPTFHTIMDPTVVTTFYNSVNNSLARGLDAQGIKSALYADIQTATAELRRQQIQLLTDAGVWPR
jgi:multiple sugar transport system substrate-binding protein